MFDLRVCVILTKFPHYVMTLSTIIKKIFNNHIGFTLEFKMFALALL